MNKPSSINLEPSYVFSVFTATYNRAHTIGRVYQSLKDQTYRNFEWLIVDDGSTDNTSELIKQWQQEADFPIRYFYQEKAGKHIAFNYGVREAKGELFLNFDSDDACVPEALERFKYHWDHLPEAQKEQFSAIACLCKDQNDQIIGTSFPFNPTDSDSLEIVHRFKVTGDKWGFQRTDILRHFPFPELPGQNFIPEGIVWSKIARAYKARFFNEPLYICFRGIDQLTNTHSPSSQALGHALWHVSILNEEIQWLTYAPFNFVRSAIHYSRFSFHVGTSIIEQWIGLNTWLGKVLWLLVLPLGYVAYLKDPKNQG